MFGDDGEWRTTVDRERIRNLADRADAEPVVAGTPDGRPALRRGADADRERLSWPAFFDRFDPERHAVRYRESAADGEPAAVEVVDREAVGAADAADAGATAEEPSTVDSDQIATSDTGDAEPVAFDRTESEGEDPGTVDEASTAPTGDAERGPPGPARALVLDEIHVAGAGLGGGDPDEEYLVFENDGEAPIDLSGWTVENDAGRTYRFPEGTDLDPGESVTLHSGVGEDDGDDCYWGAAEPVWDDQRDAVVVRTADGERVLREPYEV